jgi:hypothetical protein
LVCPIDVNNTEESLRARSVAHHGRLKVEIALPSVLNPDVIHVAEVDLVNSRIRYQAILSIDEALDREHLLLFPAAGAYASLHWPGNLFRFDHYHIKQRRDGDGICTWSVLDQADNIVMCTKHVSEFMELGRESEVAYDE